MPGKINPVCWDQNQSWGYSWKLHIEDNLDATLLLSTSFNNLLCEYKIWDFKKYPDFCKEAIVVACRTAHVCLYFMYHLENQLLKQYLELSLSDATILQYSSF